MMKLLIKRILGAAFCCLVVTSLRAQTVDKNAELLFESEFQATGDIKPFYEMEGPDKRLSMREHLMAQGEGTTSGTLAGIMSFSILGRKAPERDSVYTHFVGWLETEDGAEIMYRTYGYSAVDESDSNILMFTGTVSFPVSDDPYMQLEESSGTISGKYDMKNGSGRWKVYIKKN